MYIGDFQARFSWRAPLIILVLLIPISAYNGLLFHTLAESFAIVIAILIFVVAYNTYTFSKTHFLMYLGCGYFWVGLLDFFHTATFSSSTIFSNITPSTTIQFWIAARGLEVFLLISFTFYVHKPVNKALTFWSFGLVFTLLFYLTLNNFLPVLFSPKTGLTATKIVAEYFLILLLLIALWQAWKHKKYFNPSIYKLINLSILLTIAAEVSFTMYLNFSSISVAIGHLFKALSFWIMYIALVESTLKQPFKSLSLSSDTFNSLPDAITVVDSNGCIWHANDSARKLDTHERIVGSSVHQLFHDPNLTENQCAICQSLSSKQYKGEQEVQIGLDWFEISISPINYWSQENASLHVSRNISQRKEAQFQLKTIDRLYTVLRLTNKAIIKSRNKQDLLNSVCDIAVQYGGFSMAWIGMIKNQMVVPVSSAGDSEDYLSNIRITIDDSRYAQGPVGIAANKNRVEYINNVETDPRFEPWKEQAKQHGFHSVAAIPVMQNDICIGVFTIYSSEYDAFDSQVLDLLGSLSHDISSIMTFIKTEEKRVEAESKLQQLSRAIEQSKSAIIITDLAGVIEYINPYFSELMHYQSFEILKTNIGDLPRDLDSNEHYEACWQKVKSGQEWHGEIKNIKKNGEAFWAQQSVSPVFDRQNKVTQIVWTSKDNTELHDANETINQLAYYDALTNLPNRRLFQDRCKQAVTTAKRRNSKLALLYFDLDNFKNINDSWGHDFGDALLVHVSNVLTNCVRDMDTVTRLGGDEFAIILADIEKTADVVRIASNIQKHLNQKTRIETRELSIGTSIGISIYPNDGVTINQLMKCADMAMYHAKDKGKNNFQFFENSLNVNMQQRLNMENRIREALKDDEFELYYQPQFDINTGQISGVEALIRWFDQSNKCIAPLDFIPVAEESNLIIEIGKWVTERACQQFNQLIKQGFPAVKIAINISAKQFQQSALLIEVVREALSQSKLPSHLLQLELTESMLIKDVEETISIIDRLKQDQITFAIDDFGTGYSSFSYLKSFPVDIIKIDRSFIRDIESDLNNRAIISAMIMMAHALGLRVLAEGVENEQQLEFLKKHQCDLVQGFYYAKPMAADVLLSEYSNIKTKKSP